MPENASKKFFVEDGEIKYYGDTPGGAWQNLIYKIKGEVPPYLSVSHQEYNRHLPETVSNRILSLFHVSQQETDSLMEQAHKEAYPTFWTRLKSWFLTPFK